MLRRANLAAASMFSPMSDTTRFTAWLRALRVARDLTQEELAEQIGCAVTTLRAYESGARRPSRQMAERIAGVLALPADQVAAFVRLARQSEGQGPGGHGDTGTRGDEDNLPQHRIPVPSGERSVEPPRAAATRSAAGGPFPPSGPLPAPAAPLIGRAAELAILRERLIAPACRLVTLLGPGGFGKTRLALQAAADLQGHAAFPDGVAWAGLAPLGDPEQVAAAIAAAVGLTPQGQRPIGEQLQDYLRGRRLLLVLDNLEHLLDAAPLLSGLLAAAPALTILATSRERLRLADEWVLNLAGLPHVADVGAMPPAMLLFLDRAARVAADFALTDANRAAVAEICRILDGMPLGIELAAGWVALLAPHEIVAEIRRSLDFLSATWRDAEPRHRSLRAVFDRSWQQLGADERHLLGCLAITRGGCNREAAAAIAGRRPAAILPALAALVDRSLIRVQQLAAGTRYDLHELVRQFAAEQLAQDPAAAHEAHRRHAAHFAAFVAHQEGELRSPRLAQARAAFAAEIGNIRAAWDWACTHADSACLFQMLHATGWFYSLSGLYHEARQFYRRIVEQLGPPAGDPGAPRELQLVYWYGRAMDGWYLSTTQPARTLAIMGEAAAAIRRLDDPKKLFHTAIGIAHLHSYSGERERFEQAIAESLAAAQAAGYPWGIAQAHLVRGLAAVRRNEPEVATDALLAALASARQVGDPHQISVCQAYLADVALQQGDLDSAERSFQEVLALADAIDDQLSLLHATAGLAEVAQRRGAFGSSRQRWSEVLAIARATGNRWREAEALRGLGAVAHAEGRPDLARPLLHAALAAADSVPPAMALDILAPLIELEAAMAPNTPVLVGLCYLRHHPLAHASTRRRADELWAALSAALAAEQIAAITARAAALDPERPAALAGLLR